MAEASGPRFVTGPPFFTGPEARPVAWRQAQLMYFTDAGDLSASVDHAAADALVAAAAGVWNVPVASITVGRGGGLAEDVSGQNVYLDSSGMVWPADVMAGNAGAVPIAVIYDADGAVTDTLLGAGASDPGGCRQNSVTEAVDRFDPAGYIVHAVIVLNGRCTGSVAELQLELRYKLERAFGRVLGLAWSQTNDNVFTGVPQPTYTQAQHWPILHPVEIICGPYSYQCLPNAFELRADDVASLVAVYPIAQGTTPGPGKQQSLARAAQNFGEVKFSTGQGMAGVNVLVRRQAYNTFTAEDWVETSGVTGMQFRRAGRSAFVTGDGSAAGSMGAGDPGWLGRFWIAYTPVPDGDPWQSMIFTTEAVNPLYIGQYSLGPYRPGTVTPSGGPPVAQQVAQDASFGYTYTSFTVGDSAGTCGDGTDGTWASPTAADATGWWRGLLCGYGHASYRTLAVQAGRTLTVEVTALNEQGLATVTKAMPVVGVYAPSDEGGDVPSVAVAATAFNARGLGTTTLEVKTGSLTALRLGVADQRGDGRPDFGYQARVFYADSVVPANLSAAGASGSGGTVTVYGMGFRAGNAVSVNGVAASVTSWSANALVVTVPTMAAARASDGVAVDVVVTDISSGATSRMTQALTYGGAGGRGLVMRLVSAPEATGYAGTAMGTAFAVKMVAADGVTAVAGERVTFAAVSGMAGFSACAAAACDVVTDGQGIAAVTVTPQTPGNVVLRASDGGNGAVNQSVSFTVVAAVGSIAVLSAPAGGQPVTVTAATAFAVKVLGPDGVTGLSGRAVVFSTAASGAATFGGCFSAPCTVVTDGGGVASVTVTPVTEGAITLTASSGGVTGAASFTGTSNRDVMQVYKAPLAKVFAGDNAGKFNVRLLRVDGVTPDYTQPIVFTAPDGVVIGESGTTQATQNTDGQGYTEVTLLAKRVGRYAVTASFGSVSQSVPIEVVEHTVSLQILSAPQDGSAVGKVAATPFTVRLMQDGTTSLGNVQVQMGGTQGDVSSSACGLGSCPITTDGNGVASTLLTPLRPGQIALSAGHLGLVQSTSFYAAGPTETIRVVAAPGVGGAAAGVLAGDVVTFGVQLVGSDGTTVYVGKLLEYTVLSGPFAMTDCGFATCGGRSDDAGMGAVHGVALGAGVITLQVRQGDLSQTVSFTASSKPDVLRLMSAPAAGSYAGVAAMTSFAVQVLFADGLTVAAGKNVTLAVTSGAAVLSACGGQPGCVVSSDAAGLVRTEVTALSAGVVGLRASEGAVSVNASFNAVVAAEVLQVVSAPPDGSATGAAAAFAVRVVTQETAGRPLAGRAVTFSVVEGLAGMNCGTTRCTVTTDATGLAATMVTPLAAGSVRLLAMEGGLTQTVSFRAEALADVLQLVSAPGPAIFAGETSAQAFGVRLVHADGVTPAAGIRVVFAGSGVAFGCGASGCAVTTDANGLASTAVSGVAAGNWMLSAAADAGAGAAAVTVALEVRANVLSVTLEPGARWIAAGAVMRSVLTAGAARNGETAAGQRLVWTGSAGVRVAVGDVATGADGSAPMPVTLGPLGAGETGRATVCAGSAACAGFVVTGVAAEETELKLGEGGGQSVSGDAAYGAVTVTVRDASGHAVGGAAVSVYEAVQPAMVACTEQGRCGAAATLLTRTTVLVSAEDGTVRMLPLSLLPGQAGGSATRTEMVFTCGTQAVISTVLNRQE